VPVGPESLALRPLQQFLLPAHDIAELQRQRVEGHRHAGLFRRVEDAHFPCEHSQRPDVGDDVMHCQQQDVLMRRAAEQMDAQQRPLLQVERKMRPLG
jgi:hypothetical protein